MPRYRLDLAYDGGAFAGWQVQPGRRTVQGELMRLLSRVGETARPTGAGRTDAGVHAIGNVAHVDLIRDWEIEVLRRALTGLAPADLGLRAVDRVAPGFHARYDALARTYHYALGRRFDPFFRARRVVPRTLPRREWMEAELSGLPGERECAALARAGGEGRTTRCRILGAAWTERPEGAILSVSADRFLQGMVRTLVGTLLEGAARDAASGHLARVLAGGRGEGAGRAAPPWGLYLGAVRYPGENPPDGARDVALCAGLGAGDGAWTEAAPGRTHE